MKYHKGHGADVPEIFEGGRKQVVHISTPYFSGFELVGCWLDDLTTGTSHDRRVSFLLVLFMRQQNLETAILRPKFLGWNTGYICTMNT